MTPPPPADSETLARWRQSLEEPTTQQQLAKLLAKVPIFAGATEAFRLSIVDALVPVELRAGTTVFQEKDEGDWMGILLSGRLDCNMHKDVHTGGMKIGEVVPGGMIGDVGLLGVSKTRGVTVTVIEDSTVLVLEKAAFEASVSAIGDEKMPILEDARGMQDLILEGGCLCSLECFRRLDRDFVLALGDHLEPRLVYPGSVLMRENNYGNEMYILQIGHVKVEKGGKFIAECHGATVLGELAVLGLDKRRTATVTCVALCLVYVLHGDVFHRILENFPNSKRVFDQAYISRLVTFELAKSKDEMQHLDTFYGRAHPMTTNTMNQSVFGEEADAGHALGSTDGTMVSPRNKLSQRGISELVSGRI